MFRADTMRVAWLVGTLVLATAGCHLEEEGAVNLEPAASARVVVALPRSLPVDGVERVVVTVTPVEGEAASVELSGSGTLWQGVLRQVHSGAGATVVAQALDAEGVALGQVELPGVELARHVPALMVLVPREVESGEPVDNAAPFIDGVVGAAAAVWPGAALGLRAVAHDPNDGEALTYAWTATGGSFSDAASAAPVWTAPERRGAYTLTLRVTDARGAAATLDFTARVERGGGMGEEGPAVFNRWPSLAELGAQPGPRVRVGVPVSLQAVGADEDGDALTYAWAATCEGNFDAKAAASTRFTPVRVPQGACNNCRLSLTVRDAFGGQREETVELCVGNPQPPVIVSFSQSSPGAVSAELVRLRAEAEDPQNEALTFTWTANTGLLSPPSREGGTGEVDWTALSCLPADVTPTVGLTATNASGLSATHTFTVAWTGRRCGAHPPCNVTLASDARVRLEADCTTESTVFIPDGYTFDGAGHLLTAVDPAQGRFQGAVLRNQGGVAHVRNVRLSAGGLTDVGSCDAGENALGGILLEGAGGSIEDSEVLAVNQREQRSGCQEGVAISVRNGEDAEPVRVEVLRNRVAGYQKAGIAVAGRVAVTVEGNTVDGGGPVSHIARNGIQLVDGVTGRVAGNTVKGNAYTEADFVAAGLLVSCGVEAPCSGLELRSNTLDDNTVGIALAQPAGGTAPLPRIQVVENRLSSVRQGPGVFQAGILDYYGGGHVISRNRISGEGYDPATEPDATFAIYLETVAADRVAFLTPEWTVAPGACSEAVVVQSQDAVGNLSALAGPALVVEAAGTAAGVTLYRDAACTEALPVSGTGWALTLEAPQHEAVFYFRAVQAGGLTLTAAGQGVSAAQGHTVR